MDKQEQQEVTTVWNVPPVITWESNNNYGAETFITGIITNHGIIANIDLKTDRKTRAVTYLATVKMYQFDNEPSIVLPHGISHPFDDMRPAKEWCEQWITYAYRMLQLAKHNEALRANAKYETDRWMELQDKFNQIVRENTAQQFHETHRKHEESEL